MGVRDFLQRGVDAAIGGVEFATQNSNKPVASIKGFWGGAGFAAARTHARATSMDVLRAAKGKGWGGYALEAGGTAAIGGGIGALTADRHDRIAGAARGASLGVLGHGAYRLGRGAWGSSALHTDLRSAGNYVDNKWGGIKAGAALRRDIRRVGPANPMGIGA